MLKLKFYIRNERKHFQLINSVCMCICVYVYIESFEEGLVICYIIKSNKTQGMDYFTFLDLDWFLTEPFPSPPYAAWRNCYLYTLL